MDEPAAIEPPAPPAPPTAPPTPPERPEKPRYDPAGKSVPEGLYAVPSRTGANDLDFYKVDVGRGPRWEGFRFVERIVGGTGAVRIGRTQAADALIRIQHYGIDESMARYGQEMGTCGKCGRSLTDAVSRAIGIGPICRQGMGDEMRNLLVPPVDPDMPDRPLKPVPLPTPVEPPPTIEEVEAAAKAAEPPPPAEPTIEEKPGETFEDALRDEMRIRGMKVLDTEGASRAERYPTFSFIGNTYAHNATWQSLKGRGVWGKSLPSGAFAWHCRKTDAELVLEAFNAERAARIRDRGYPGPGEGSGGTPGVRPGPGEPGGAGGGATGVGTRGIPWGSARGARGVLHADDPEATWQRIEPLTNEQLAAIEPPEPVTTLDPSLSEILDPSNQPDVCRMVDAWKRGEHGFMLGNGTGTGKTYCALGFLKMIGTPRTLIIVPGKSVAQQWVDTVRDFGIEVHARVPTGAPQDATGIFVTTYAMARLQEPLGNFGVFIPDEIHQQGMKLIQGKRTAELMADLSKRSKMTVYSTATPYESPSQVYYLRELRLWRPRAGEWREWAQKHGISYEEKFIGKYKPPATTAVWRGTRDSKLTDMLRIRAEILGTGKGVARDLVIHQPLRAKFSSLHPHGGEYGTTVARALEAIDDLSAAAVRTNMVKRLLDYVKLDTVADAAADAVQRGQHVVVMVSNKSPFRFEDPFPEEKVVDEDGKVRKVKVDVPSSAIREEAIRLFRSAGLTGELPAPTKILRDKIAARLGHENVHVYTGDVSQPTREKLKAQFNAGSLPCLVSTIAAGGTGLSLHDKVGDAPRTQVNCGLPWTGKDFQQMIGRTYRLGTASPVEMEFYFTDHPRERRVASVVAGRLTALRAGVQGVTAETNAAKLLEFAIRGSDIEDDVDAEEGHAPIIKSSFWMDLN
jgi:hypothetical protein